LDAFGELSLLAALEALLYGNLVVKGAEGSGEVASHTIDHDTRQIGSVCQEQTCEGIGIQASSDV